MKNVAHINKVLIKFLIGILFVANLNTQIALAVNPVLSQPPSQKGGSSQHSLTGNPHVSSCDDLLTTLQNLPGTLHPSKVLNCATLEDPELLVDNNSAYEFKLIDDTGTWLPAVNNLPCEPDYCGPYSYIIASLEFPTIKSFWPVSQALTLPYYKQDNPNTFDKCTDATCNQLDSATLYARAATVSNNFLSPSNSFPDQFLASYTGDRQYWYTGTYYGTYFGDYTPNPQVLPGTIDNGVAFHSCAKSDATFTFRDFITQEPASFPCSSNVVTNGEFYKPHGLIQAGSPGYDVTLQSAVMFRVPSAIPKITLSVDKTEIPKGDSFTVTWKTEGTTSLAMDGAAVDLNGSKKFTDVKVDTIVNFKATSARGRTSENSISVTVRDLVYRFFMGVNGWKYSSATNHQLVGFSPNGSERPLSGVTVSLSCVGSPSQQATSVGSDGLVELSEYDAISKLKCPQNAPLKVEFPNFNYTNAGLIDGSASIDPMYPYVWSKITNSSGSVPYTTVYIHQRVGQQGGSDERIIGIRPAIYGRVTEQNVATHGIGNKMVCAFYLQSEAAADNTRCDKSRVSFSALTDSYGYFMINNLKWGDWQRSKLLPGSDGKVYLKALNFWSNVNTAQHYTLNTPNWTQASSFAYNPFVLDSATGLGTYPAANERNCSFNCAQAVVDSAIDHVGQDSTDFYRDPDVACASVVSSILISAGQIPAAGFRAACPALTDQVSAVGGTNILPTEVGREYEKYSNFVNQNHLSLLQPGDVIFYWADIYSKNKNGRTTVEHRWGHVAIYIGNGMTVQNSSKSKTVVRRSIGDLISSSARSSSRVYYGIGAFRLPCQDFSGRGNQAATD